MKKIFNVLALAALFAACIGLVSCRDTANFVSQETAKTDAAEEFSVTFNQNPPYGVPMTGAMPPQAFAEGKPQALAKCAFFATGWKFLGWSKSAYGEVEFADEETVEISAYTPLYAQWALCGDLDEVKAALGRLVIGEYNVQIAEGDSIEGLGDFLKTGLHKVKLDLSQMELTEIPADAFSECSLLKSIKIPNSVTSIGGSAFSGCLSLASITIPDGVTSIGGSAFEDCTSLESIIIPDGVTSIDNYAFRNCASLSSIDIPDSVESIGSGAFNIARLKKFTLRTLQNGVLFLLSQTISALITTFI